MKTFYQSLLTIAALALSAIAYAQVPLGTWTGNDTSDEYFNTGMGTHALFSVTPNTAECGNLGTGSCNTASGYEALYSNTIGQGNTAVGVDALQANEKGSFNTATGGYALNRNQAGNNTATGYYALGNNDKGRSNTATGFEALLANASGDFNTASGFDALEYNNTGQLNTAIGVYALRENRAGSYNTASGVNALYTLKDGKYNIADGYQAGAALTTGSYNIDVGNVGMGADSGIIRIGTFGQQTQAFIAGIEGAQVTGSAVFVTSSGQLGVLASSERFKTAIAPMGSDTGKLGQLRPVTFKLKSDSTGIRQYGLIAEEVARVYPELVIRNEKGKISGVRYDELAPMLLNEVQQQQQMIAAMQRQLAQIQVALLDRAKP